MTAEHRDDCLFGEARTGMQDFGQDGFSASRVDGLGRGRRIDP